MKPRVLIVDDDDAITQQLYWTLCDEYDVMVANDLPTAIRRAKIYEPAVSILDLHLPPAVSPISTRSTAAGSSSCRSCHRSRCAATLRGRDR